MRTMRKLIIIISFLAAAIASYSQSALSLQIRGGYDFKTSQPIISGSMDLSGHNIHLTPELIVNTGNNTPAHFGLKASYEYPINNWSIQAGCGYFFELYSTDKYDANLNGFIPIPFTAIHYKNFFIQYDYVHGSQISIGYREQINNVIR